MVVDLKTTWLLLSYFSDRKKVLDFYQRACLSGYCSAFAYKPMNCTLSSQLNGKCIELVQAPGQNSIFTMCELPSTVPIKSNIRRSSWSSDGTELRLSQWEWHRVSWGRKAQELMGFRGPQCHSADSAMGSHRNRGASVALTSSWYGESFSFSSSKTRCLLSLPCGCLRCSRGLMYIKVFS